MASVKTSMSSADLARESYRLVEQAVEKGLSEQSVATARGELSRLKHDAKSRSEIRVVQAALNKLRLAITVRDQTHSGTPIAAVRRRSAR